MTICFAGGGTLGSVMPLLAVAEEIRATRPRAKFLWIGTARGPERALVARAGLRFIALPAGKLRRYWSWRNLSDGIIVAFAVLRAYFLLRRERPDVVVGAGAYVQVPVMLAARALHIPIVTHQLDARPSLANTLVARWAASRTAAFGPNGIGVPVRRALIAARAADARAAKQHFGFSGDRPVLLVLGGSSGAAALNALTRGAVAALVEQVDVIHMTGTGKEEQDDVHRAGYHAFPFLGDDLLPAYAAADLVISRAGMGTIAELSCLGKPAVFVPMPESHQEENAKRLEELDVAAVWHQQDLATPEVFARRVLDLFRDAPRRAAFGRAFARAFPENAAATLATIVLRVATQRGARRS